MKRTIFTGFSPNVELDDVLLSCLLLIQPWKWRKGQAVYDLEKRFKNDFGMAEAVSFESGRTSLTVLLQTSSLNSGDEVAVQAYTCVAVPNAVLWAGLKPLYIDCDSLTLTMSPEDLEKKINPRVKAIIVQYTFGQIGKLERILEIARKHHLIIIEDCAHTIGGWYGSNLLGTLGDASFFSFGRDKVISGVFGGLAMTKNINWGKRLREKQQSFPLPRNFWIFQQLIHPVITYKVKLLYDFFGVGRLCFFLVKKMGVLSRAVESEERLGKYPRFVFHQMSNALALLANHQYAKLGRFNDHRQKVADEYRKSLNNLIDCGLPPEDDSVIPLRFTLQVGKRIDLLEVARVNRIYLGDWYESPIAPKDVDFSAVGYTEGSCPNAERLALSSVNLPTDIHINKRMTERIIRVVRSQSTPSREQNEH